MEVFGMGEQVNSCLSHIATRTKEHCEGHFACTQPASQLPVHLLLN